MRVYLLYLFVAGFSVFAWRNWFVSLCASIFLMAFVGHDDMPRSIGGIQGLNPWNLLFLNVLLAWWFRRGQQGLFWDMPKYLNKLLLAYGGIVTISFLRLFFNPGDWPKGFTSSYVISEYFINCVKWVFPGLLLFDACRSERRIRIALLVTLGLYLLLALQVLRYVPWSCAVSGDNLSARAYKAVQNGVGYNRVTLSMMLGGASWAVLITSFLWKTYRAKFGMFALAGLVAFGQALTGGRTGYVSWVMVGLALGLLRWHRLLLLIPIAGIAVMILLPGVGNRILMGLGGQQGVVLAKTDTDLVTSGRTKIWPYVIDKVKESPVLGFGRLAMRTTGLTQWLEDELNEDFGHPHNAYLEQLLDNGVIGFLCVVPFYGVVLGLSFRLLRDPSDPLFGVVGGATCAVLLALMIGSLAGQTFYPREGSVGMWALIGLMLRMHVERQHSLEIDQPLFYQYEKVVAPPVSDPVPQFTRSLV